MKKKIVKNILLLASMCFCFLFVTSFYNFITGFPHTTNIKTRRYNEIRAQYSKVLQDKPEQFEIKTEDDIDISGIIMYRPKSDSVLLICHGYKQSKEHLISLANLFDEYTVVLFDLRAHGDSGGNLVSFGYHEYKDVIAVLDYLKKDSRFMDKKFYGLGISMGAASVAKAAANGSKFDCLILDSCFSNIDFDVVSSFVRIPKIFFNFGKFIFKAFWKIDIDSIKPGAFLSKVDCPMLFIHSRNDEKIACSHTNELYNEALACQQKSIVLCDGLHGKLFSHDSAFYKKTIIDFLSKI
jgi:uncharacterized protein